MGSTELIKKKLNLQHERLKDCLRYNYVVYVNLTNIFYHTGVRTGAEYLTITVSGYREYKIKRKHYHSRCPLRKLFFVIVFKGCVRSGFSHFTERVPGIHGGTMSGGGPTG